MAYLLCVDFGDGHCQVFQRRRERDEREALLYQSGGDRLFLLFSSSAAGTAQHQLAAWVVEDLEAEVAPLRGRGVVLEEYDSPALHRRRCCKHSRR